MRHEVLYEGENKTFTKNWSADVGRLGTSVSSVAWSVDPNGSTLLTLSNEALSSNEATAQVAAAVDNCGYGFIKATATFADGQKFTETWKVDVIDVY